MDRAAYTAQLQALLPSGAAWPREPEAALTRLLDALAAELAIIDGRAAQLIEEADPRSTSELLPDWERVVGLPDPCAGDDQTLAGRRERLVQKLTTRGGQSRAYFIRLAAALGYPITITEFRPFTCNSYCDDGLDPDPWRFVWRVNAPAVTIRPFTAESGCDEPIRAWGNEVLECAISRHKPAHTNVIFGYGANA